MGRIVDFDITGFWRKPVLRVFKNLVSGYQLNPDIRFLPYNSGFSSPDIWKCLVLELQKTGFSRLGELNIRFSSLNPVLKQILTFLRSENAGFLLTKNQISDSLKIRLNPVFWTGYEAGLPSLTRTSRWRKGRTTFPPPDQES